MESDKVIHLRNELIKYLINEKKNLDNIANRIKDEIEFNSKLLDNSKNIYK